MRIVLAATQRCRITADRSVIYYPKAAFGLPVAQMRIEYLYYQLSPTEKKRFTVLKVRAQQVVDEMLGNGFQFGEDKPVSTETEVNTKAAD